MHIGRMAPRAHGSGRVVVRGTVVSVTPAKPASGLFRWFKEDALPLVIVKIDDEPHRLLMDMFRRRTEAGGVAQTFTIGWNMPDELPAQGERAWVTFCYAGPLENFFQGAPPISFGGIETIRDERDSRDGELVEQQLSMAI